MTPTPAELPLQALLAGARAGAWPEAEVVAVRDGEVLVHESLGRRGVLFDVASLTKVFTATLVLDLLDPADLVPWLPGPPTLQDLLAHRSGLPAWRPFFAQACREQNVRLSELLHSPELQRKAWVMVRAALGASPTDAPRPTYSDLGFLALGLELEARTNTALADLVKMRVTDPLGLRSVQWGSACPDAMPTGLGRPRPGNPSTDETTLSEPSALDCLVDDDNAAALGGGCGHAGIWANCEDIARLGDHLRRAAEGPGGFLPTQRAGLLFERASGSRTFGLDTPSGPQPAIGTVLGRGPLGAAGHLGFTGCSLWIDRDARLSVALLSNAVAVSRPNLALRSFRPRVYDAVARSCP